MSNKFKSWVKKVLGIIELESQSKLLQAQTEHTYKLIAQLREDVDEHKRFDVDVGYRGSSTVVLTGIYRGKGYIRFYDVPQEEFKNLVERMREMNIYGLLRNVDSPVSLKGIFDYE